MHPHVLPLPPQTHVFPPRASPLRGPVPLHAATLPSGPPAYTETALQDILACTTLEDQLRTTIEAGALREPTLDQTVDLLVATAQLISEQLRFTKSKGGARSQIGLRRAKADIDGAKSRVQIDYLPKIVQRLPQLSAGRVTDVLAALNEMQVSYVAMTGLIDAVVRHFPKINLAMTSADAAKLLAQLAPFAVELAISAAPEQPLRVGQTTRGAVKLSYMLLVLEDRLIQGLNAREITPEDGIAAVATLVDVGPALYEPCPEIYSALSSTVTPVLGDLPAGQLARLLHVLGSFPEIADTATASEMLPGLPEAARATLPEVNPSEFGQLLWGFAQLQSSFRNSGTDLGEFLRDVDNVTLYRRCQETRAAVRAQVMENGGQVALNALDSPDGVGIDAIGCAEQPVSAASQGVPLPAPDVQLDEPWSSPDGNPAEEPEQSSEAFGLPPGGGPLVLDDVVDVFHVAYFLRVYRESRKFTEDSVMRLFSAVVGCIGKVQTGSAKLTPETVDLVVGSAQLLGECLHYDRLKAEGKLKEIGQPGYWLVANLVSRAKQQRVPKENDDTPKWYWQDRTRWDKIPELKHPVVGSQQ